MLRNEFPATVIPVDIHTSQAYAFAEGQARASWYGVSGVPDVRIDGKYSVVGASNCNTAYSNYRSRYITRMNEVANVSPVEIEGVWSIAGDTGTITVTYRLVDPVPQTGVQATLFIYEDDVYYNASTTFNHLARALRNEAVTGLTNQGDEVTIVKTIPINAGWDQDQLHCAAVLQKTSGTKDMIQAASIPYLSDFTVNMPHKVASVPTGSGYAYFEGTVTNDTSSPDVMTFSFDNGFGWPGEFQVEGDPNWYSAPTAFDFGALEGKEITLRVLTDGVKRIGTGSFLSSSQNSGRTYPMSLRIFNRSYSILFVDDDGTRTDETVWTDAIDGIGWLYEDWDVYNGHGNLGPTFNNMAGFDAVLWQHGYFLSSLFSTADTTAIKTYLDDGGKIFVSSMDFLNFVSGTRLFLREYMGVETHADGVTANSITGVGGDPITDGMNMALTFPSGANRVDQVNPSSTASAILHNHNSLPVAVRNERVNGSKAVYNCVPPNAMPAADPDPNNARALIEKTVLWLVGGSDPGSVDDLPAALAGRLSVNPNPSVGAAALSFSVSPAAAGSPVRLTVVDVTGRLVRTLVDGRIEAGSHQLSWDGTDAAGRPVPSGIYFARIESSDQRDARKVVVTR